MFDYLHDEWCATKFDGSPDCDCVRQILLDKDAQVALLEQRVEELEEARDHLYEYHHCNCRSLAQQDRAQ